MNKPPAIWRGGERVRQVPAVESFAGSLLSSCEGCVYAKETALNQGTSCAYPKGTIGNQCIDRNTIYIEATPEAWAQYLMSKIRHNLGETS